MKTAAHLAPDWRDMDDHQLRDCIEVNESMLRFVQENYPRHKRLISRHKANLELAQPEEDRRVRLELNHDDPPRGC